MTACSIHYTINHYSLCLCLCICKNICNLTWKVKVNRNTYQNCREDFFNKSSLHVLQLHLMSTFLVDIIPRCYTCLNTLSAHHLRCVLWSLRDEVRKAIRWIDRKISLKKPHLISTQRRSNRFQWADFI